MRPITLMTTLLPPLATAQSKFCERSTPAPTDDEVKARHEKFVDAFLVKKDVVEAFTYIASDYIVSRAPPLFLPTIPVIAH
jgi:hypothetical protein